MDIDCSVYWPVVFIPVFPWVYLVVSQFPWVILYPSSFSCLFPYLLRLSHRLAPVPIVWLGVRWLARLWGTGGIWLVVRAGGVGSRCIRPAVARWVCGLVVRVTLLLSLSLSPARRPCHVWLITKRARNRVRGLLAVRVSISCSPFLSCCAPGAFHGFPGNIALIDLLLGIITASLFGHNIMRH